MKIRRQIFLSILTFTLLGHAVAAQEITVAAAADLQSAMQDSPSARYTITELGTLGGNYSFSYGLNNAGVVAGGAATATQTDFVSQTGFLWYRGQIINVGTLGGAA